MVIIIFLYFIDCKALIKINKLELTKDNKNVSE